MWLLFNVFFQEKVSCATLVGSAISRVQLCSLIHTCMCV